MTMSTLSLSELKRLTRPYANKADEEEAFRYWVNATIEERLVATRELTLAHYRELGVDVDKPMEKTLVRRTVPWLATEGN